MIFADFCFLRIVELGDLNVSSATARAKPAPKRHYAPKMDAKATRRTRELHMFEQNPRRCAKATSALP